MAGDDVGSPPLPTGMTRWLNSNAGANGTCSFREGTFTQGADAHGGPCQESRTVLATPVVTCDVVCVLSIEKHGGIALYTSRSGLRKAVCIMRAALENENASVENGSRRRGTMLYRRSGSVVGGTDIIAQGSKEKMASGALVRIFFGSENRPLRLHMVLEVLSGCLTRRFRISSSPT